MELLVLDANFTAVTVIDSFRSMIWTDRYNSYGDFELYLPVDSSMLYYLQQDNYLWTKDSEHCMIIEDITIDSDVEEGNYLKVTGRSLESILTRRIVWGQTILNGSMQDAIQTLLNDAFISPSNEARKVDNFIFEASTDPAITELTIDTQYTGDDLYTVVQTLCEANRIGFKIVLNDQNQFVFSLYAGADRSYDQIANPYVIFSPSFENIINSNYYTSNAELKNVTLVAGEGEGASRRMTSVGDTSGLTRREIFTDARDVSSDVDGGTLSSDEYISQLYARGVEKLAECGIKTAFEGEVDATRMFKYGEDFFIGDIVQIANEYGHEGKVYISELVLSHDETGYSVYPTFQTLNEEGEDSL